jgi:solute carrier family 9 (sodium/hydrogen exchanger), member 10/11
LILSGGGPILGLIFGLIVSNLLKRIHNNFVLEVNTTVAFAYAMFYIAEFLSSETSKFKLSGILALVTFGLYMSFSGKT